MPHSRSAQKRMRQNTKHRALNRWRKKNIKDAVKAFEAAVHEGDVAKAEQQYRDVTRVIDKIAAKGTVHKNTAARRKSRLAQQLNAMKASAGS